MPNRNSFWTLQHTAYSSLCVSHVTGFWRFSSCPVSIGDCLSLVTCMTMEMAVPSQWLWGGHKRTTEHDKLPGSDHLQCPCIGTYTPYTCWVSWCGTYMVYNFGLRAPQAWVSIVAVWRCVLGQGTSPTGMCTLSTQGWMGTWLGSDCLCAWIVPVLQWQQGLYAPQGIELVLE